MAATMITLGGQLCLSPALTVRKSAALTPRASLQCGVSAPIGARRLLSAERPVETGRRMSVIVKASEVDTSQITPEYVVKKIKETWEKTDDKLAIGGLGVAGLILLWASFGLVGAIEKLPLISGFFEIVGLLFTGWFIYRYVLFKPDREELLKVVDEAKEKITGQ